MHLAHKVVYSMTPWLELDDTETLSNEYCKWWKGMIVFNHPQQDPWAKVWRQTPAGQLTINGLGR
jgi:hypothetical protein